MRRAVSGQGRGTPQWHFRLLTDSKLQRREGERDTESLDTQWEWRNQRVNSWSCSSPLCCHCRMSVTHLPLTSWFHTAASSRWCDALVQRNFEIQSTLFAGEWRSILTPGKANCHLGLSGTESKMSSYLIFKVEGYLWQFCNAKYISMTEATTWQNKTETTTKAGF